MKRLDINSIIYYGRFYCHNDPLYYLDLNNYGVYKKSELINNFGIEENILLDNYILQNDYGFALMFRVNMIDLMRRFLNSLNNRKLSSKIKDLDSEQLYVFFQKHIEIFTGDHQRWIMYDKKCLTESALKWCNELHIPYDV